MDIEQKQSEGLLNSLDEEIFYDIKTLVNEQKYEQSVTTSKKRKWVGYLPWLVHLAAFSGYIIFISQKIPVKVETDKQWPGMYLFQSCA